jgi:hypothetical protein
MFIIPSHDDNRNGMTSAAQRHTSHPPIASSDFKSDRSFCRTLYLKLAMQNNVKNYWFMRRLSSKMTSPPFRPN